MKFELPSLTSDEAVLRLSAAASGVAAAHHGLQPRQAHNAFWAPSTPFSEVTSRYMGLSSAGLSGVQLAVSAAEGSRPAKKQVLKAAGVLWMVAAAMDAHYADSGAARKEAKAACAAASAALGALCLWRGFAKDAKPAASGDLTATAGATDSRAAGSGKGSRAGPSAGGALLRG